MNGRRPRLHRAVQAYTQAGSYVGFGFQFAFTILAFLFAGRWLDARFGTAPWLLVVGVFGGAAAGFVTLYRDLVVRPRGKDTGGSGACGKGSSSGPASRS